MNNKQNTLSKIAIDLDGVVFDFHTPFLQFYNKKNGTNFVLEDFYDYDFSKVLGVFPEMSEKAIFDFYHSSEFTKVPAISESISSIKKLVGEGHILGVVTSRPDFTQQQTSADLVKHFPNSPFRIHFTNHFHGIGKKRKKSEVCLEEGYSLIIEDAPEHANDCAENGIKVILINRSWNIKEKLHPSIIRVNDWGEILKHLEVLK